MEGKVGHDVQVLIFGQEVDLLRGDGERGTRVSLRAVRGTHAVVRHEPGGRWTRTRRSRPSRDALRVRRPRDRVCTDHTKAHPRLNRPKSSRGHRRFDGDEKRFVSRLRERRHRARGEGYFFTYALQLQNFAATLVVCTHRVVLVRTGPRAAGPALTPPASRAHPPWT